MKTFQLSTAAVIAATVPTIITAQPNVEPITCSCTPNAYKLSLNFEGTCTNDSTDGSDGIDGSICFFTQGGSPDELVNDSDLGVNAGVVNPSNTRGRRLGSAVVDNEEWVDTVLSKIDFTTHIQHAQATRQLQSDSLDTAPTKITSVTFLETDTTPDLNIINQDSTYFDIDGSNGDILEYTSISSTLDVNVPIGDQLDKVPGGVILVLFGENAAGEVIQNRVAWGYKRNYCNEEPVAVGTSIGWQSLDGFTSAFPEFCDAVTASPTPAPVASETRPPVVSPPSPTPGDHTGDTTHSAKSIKTKSSKALFSKGSKSDGSDAKAQKAAGDKSGGDSKSGKNGSKGNESTKSAKSTQHVVDPKAEKVSDNKKSGATKSSSEKGSSSGKPSSKGSDTKHKSSSEKGATADAKAQKGAVDDSSAHKGSSTVKSESAKGEAKSSKESSSDDKSHSDSKADKHDSKATKVFKKSKVSKAEDTASSPKSGKESSTTAKGESSKSSTVHDTKAGKESDSSDTHKTASSGKGSSKGTDDKAPSSKTEKEEPSKSSTTVDAKAEKESTGKTDTFSYSKGDAKTPLLPKSSKTKSEKSGISKQASKSSKTSTGKTSKTVVDAKAIKTSTATFSSAKSDKINTTNGYRAIFKKPVRD